MEKKHTEPSLEHSRLLILERIGYLKNYVAHLELCATDGTGIRHLQQELTGHQQALKVFDSHYALLEALKEVVRISDRKHDAWDKAKEAINNCE